MPKPSVFTQLDAVAINARTLLPSPRTWNCGLMRYRDRLWLAYRYHQKALAGRCATAIVELDEKTMQPKGKSHPVPLDGPTGTEHHEDGRLFIFKGEPYLSFTEMRGYRPGVDYTCVMKYARLKLHGTTWKVDAVWHPNYGRNDGRSKEKNWVFFEHDGAIHVVYSGSPEHVVLRLDGDRVVKVYQAPSPVWHFGTVRGGTPPLLQPDGTFMSFFHSSVNTEVAPHFVRYYAAAYTFESKPPFTPLRISTKPLMAGSEADGHQVDPRYVEGWKPYVVFPCGLVEREPGNGWLVSLGVNDWQCAIAKMRADQLFLGAANGTDIRPRYFQRNNGTIPIQVNGDAGARKRLIEWVIPRGRHGMAGVGYMMCENPREAQEVAEFPDVEEVEFADYDQAISRMRATI